MAAAKSCPEQGCGGDPKLNTQKNRTDKAQEASPEEMSVGEIIDLDLPAKWKSGQACDDAEEIGEGKAVVVKGYMIDPHKAAPETCNCYVTGVPPMIFISTWWPGRARNPPIR